MENITEIPLEEISTAELEMKLCELNEQADKIRFIGQGQGHTPQYWGFAAKITKVFQVLERRKRRNNPDEFIQATGQI